MAESNRKTRPGETGHQGKQTPQGNKPLGQARADAEQPAGEYETSHDDGATVPQDPHHTRDDH